MNAIPDRVVRIKTVLDRTGISRSTLYRKIQEGSFPRQAKLGIHGAGWSEAAINEWIANLFARRPDGEIQ
jgi:prophage regulatory protein